MPVISIIIPVYNTKPYLSRCIGSVLNQNYADFELLLIDDGSSDGSHEICDAYAKTDSRVHVFHKDNGGVSSARNMGLNHAKGEWVYFVDSDDEVLPGGLQTLVNCISDEVDIVMGGYVDIDEGGNSSVVDDRVELILSKKQSLVSLYGGYGSYYPYCGYLWMRLLRKSVIQQHHLLFDSDLAIKEDTLFLTRYVCKSNGISRQTTTPVYKYYRRPDSAMGRAERSLDARYVDSFYALVQMKHEVEASFPSYSFPVFVAKQAILGRYDIIVGMMDSSGMRDTVLKEQLHKVMIAELGSKSLFKVRRKILKYIRKVRDNKHKPCIATES